MQAHSSVHCGRHRAMEATALELASNLATCREQIAALRAALEQDPVCCAHARVCIRRRWRCGAAACSCARPDPVGCMRARACGCTALTVRVRARACVWQANGELLRLKAELETAARWTAESLEQIRHAAAAAMLTHATALATRTRWRTFTRAHSIRSHTVRTLLRRTRALTLAAEAGARSALLLRRTPVRRKALGRRHNTLHR